MLDKHKAIVRRCLVCPTEGPVAGAYISYVALYIQVLVVAGKFLTQWPNPGVSIGLLLRNREREREYRCYIE